MYVYTYNMYILYIHDYMHISSQKFKEKYICELKIVHSSNINGRLQQEV